MTKDIQSPNLVPVVSRARLVRLAYRYLGTVSDAEDIVQEACLRLLHNPDVRNAEAWLARVVTNASLDRLRQIGARRETYIGPWLPEPVIETEETPFNRELDISFAVMRTLEALSPLERAAFFLHDLFDMDFKTVGETLGRSPVTARKLASRARQAVKSSRTRYSATPDDVERFLSAI
jgi:RNA polymerase sigma-70 factor (ECF subfamily)